jgi:hypothetical protein
MSVVEAGMVLAPVAGLSAYVAAHLALSHLCARRGQMLALVAGAVAGMVVSIAAGLSLMAQVNLAMSDRVGLALVNALTYLGLAFGYFNFVNLNIASLRIRILKELRARPDRSVSRAHLEDTYGVSRIVEARLARMTKSGQLVERGGRYDLGRREALRVAQVLWFFKWLILGRRWTSGGVDGR